MAAKRYVLVGAGGRGISMFGQPLVDGEVGGVSELVGLCDNNASRMRAACELMGVDLPGYTDFEKMLAELAPDGLVITSKDSTHAEYIVKGLRAGKRVLSEKPLCTTVEQCRDILAAKASSSAQGFCTHNARYGPAVQTVKEIVTSGRLGDVLTIQYEESLDRRHGADYFRRWHRRKANSGGLLIHKASHHFDMLNWLADSLPDMLMAYGGLSFYGKNGPFRGKRCMGCPHAEPCPFHADVFANERSRKLYLECEGDDGYMRDGCVFDQEIDIEDAASVIYNYQNGIRVTYALQAFAAYEGERIVIEGTKARLELIHVKDTKWAVAGDVTVFGMEEMVGNTLRIFEPGGSMTDVEVRKAEGSHGGSDPKLRQELLGRDWDLPPTERMAPLEQAIQAVMVGAAANQSIATGQPVDVQALLKG